MTFLKPFRIKSSSQMKGSDKKKLRARVLAQFGESGLAEQPITEDNLNALLPLKEDVAVSKIYTFGGDSLLVYIAGKNAVFFEHDKEKLLVPSVYTLWKFPLLLPVFTTWTQVMSRIANGADLMLPGIIVDQQKGLKAYMDGKLKKGDLVAVNLSSNLAPIAVGRANLSSEDMYMAANRGKGVELIHFYGDQLWAAGSRCEVPDLGRPSLPCQGDGQSEEPTEENSEEEEECQEKKEDVKTEKDEPDSIASKLENITLKEEAASDPLPSEEPEQEEDTRSPQEIMDSHLHFAFNQSWRTTAKKIELPILTSNFFRLHMVKNCPPTVSLDVKKSSFKKLSKFLAEKEKYGVIKIKELQKGVESIVEVNLEHEDIKLHRVIKFDKGAEHAEESEKVLPCDKDYEPPTINELHFVNGAVQKLFKACNIQKGTPMLSGDVRQVVTKYVKEADLQIQNNKSKVKLDPLIAEVVLGKDENHVVEMKWDDLLQRIISKMSDGYSIQFAGLPPHIVKGKVEPVELATATRSGNKKVTLIYNLETFKINPKDFAHKCQVGVAASTSVNPATNRKAGSEVMIQGNHVAFAGKLLVDDYKIPRKYIKGLENAAKKKK